MNYTFRCSSEVEQSAVNGKVAGSIPAAGAFCEHANVVNYVGVIMEQSIMYCLKKLNMWWTRTNY